MTCAAERRAVVLLSLWLGALLGLLLASPASGGARPPWHWPQDRPPQVVGAFRPPASAYGAGHRGVDLAGRPGDRVLAVGAGRVVHAGLLAGRGVVSVDHGALRTTYEPVTALVGVGDRVLAGEQLGTLDAGHPGCPVLACLHLGLRRGAAYLDPHLVLRSGPSVLLPRGRATAGLPGASRVGSGAQSGSAAGSVAGAAATPPDPGRATAPGRAADPGRGATTLVAARPAFGPQRVSLGTAATTVVVAGALGVVLAARGAGRRSGAGVVSRAGRRACRAAGARPWCASGRSATR